MNESAAMECYAPQGTQRQTMAQQFDGIVISTKVDEPLARAVAGELGSPAETFVDPGLRRFENSEFGARIKGNVRRRDVYVIGSLCRDLSGLSTNDALMQLLVLVDALVRASVNAITVIVPYLGYAKQERKKHGRQPISAKLIMDMLSLKPQVKRIVCMDLHAPAIQGFINLPVDNISARPALLNVLRRQGLVGDRVVVVSPDAGGAERAREFQIRLKTGWAIMSKFRNSSNEVESVELIGNVKGKIAVIVDDMVQSGGTLFAAAMHLIEAGANRVVVVATHADFCGKVAEKLSHSMVEQLIVTDTIPLVRQSDVASCSKITIVPIQQVLSEAIRRIHFGESLSELFD